MKTYVWSLPTRVFHWMLVLFVVLAFLTSESDPWLNQHAAVGYGIGVLILFRIYWGFAGPRYARFTQWPLSLREAIRFSKNILHAQDVYMSHNPAASFVMLGIIMTLFLLTITGILAYGVQEGRGILAFLNASLSQEMNLFVEVHAVLSTLLLLLVGAHISGVLVDTCLHPRHHTLGSIFDGYKHIKGTATILTPSHKVFAVMMLSVALGVTLYTSSFQNTLTQSRYNQIDYDTEHPLFAEECASCHTLYPPTLLPERSWRALMRNLENHFGDDASLEAKEEKSILAYLLKHSAESATSESAVHILKTFPDKPIIAITQTPYWEKRHKEIADDIFQSEKIKSKANCKACHSDVEKGMLEDMNIKIPTMGR